MTLALDDDLTVADLFCGAGGSITGMAQAGFRPVIGVNHSPRSIETVSVNHPEADFLCADINHLDMRRLPRTRVLWASVICTELSPAGGRRKLRGQGVLPELEEYGHVPADAYERTRACALDVIRATEVHRYEAIVVENVVEFARDWELYDWWVEGMCKLGYECQVANLSAAHVYDEGELPAPQWRDRIFIVFTLKGIPQPDLNLRPPAWCDSCDQVVESEQRWKNPARRRIGKYGQQYLYICPRCSSIVEPFVSPAIRAIDLTDIGERIGDRKRPLSEKTLARIDWGLEFLAWPVIAQVAGNTFERPGYHRVWPAEGSPLMTRQATDIDAICGPVIANHGHDGDRVFAAAEAPLPTRATKISEGVAFAYIKNYGGIDEARYRAHPAAHTPLGAITTQDSHGLVSAPLPFVTMLRKNATATGIDEPLATMATSGTHHYLTTPPGSFYMKNFGGNAQPRHLAKPLVEPLGSITTHDHHALVIPYRKGSRPRRAADGPLAAITTKTAEGVLHPAISREDCHYRTLKPREHLRAQDFDDSYVVTGNLGEQTAQAGNAVAVNCARWIGRRLAAVLS